MKTNLYQSLFLLFVATGVICCGKKETWVHPTLAPITDLVFAPGHVEPLHQYVLTSVNEAYLQKQFYKENDVVQAGDVLFTLDSRTPDLQETAARDQLRYAEQQASPGSPVLQQLQQEWQAAEARRQHDSVELHRLERLYESQSVATMEVETMRTQYDVSTRQARSLWQSLLNTRRGLQQAVTDARTQYQMTLAGRQYFNLSSPATARLYQVYKKPGELVRKGEAVALLGHPDSIKVILLVDEASISNVSVGQPVTITLNTSKQLAFEGVVDKIFPFFDAESQAYTIEARFVSRPRVVIAGTLVQANITVAHKPRALLIPRVALRADGKVTVRRDGKKEIVDIQPGITATEWVEILNGVSVEDEILIED